jgi:hypothetical protein
MGFGLIYRFLAYLRFFPYGFHKFTVNELESKAFRDVQALSQFLGGKYYTMGAKVSKNDALLFAFLLCVLESPISTPVREMVYMHDNLMNYHAKMKDRFLSNQK